MQNHYGESDSMNNKIAKIFGYILGDGWIDIQGQCGVSGDNKSLLNIVHDIDELFGGGTSRKLITRDTYSKKYGIRGKSTQFRVRVNFSRLLQSLGMPIGKRVSSEFQIPDWIINGSLEIKKKFISGYYAAEGSIPHMQTNKKTPKALEFMFSKNIELLENSRLLVEQFQKILKDIGLDSFVVESFEFTNSEKVKQTIYINNSEEMYLKALKLLELDYCIPKEIQRKNLIIYFELKNIERQKILELRDKIFNERKKNGTTYVELAKMFGLTFGKIERLFSGKNKCKLVRHFPKYDEEFIKKYCLACSD